MGRGKTVVEALKMIGFATQSLETEGLTMFSEPNTMIFLARTVNRPFAQLTSPHLDLPP